MAGPSAYVGGLPGDTTFRQILGMFPQQPVMLRMIMDTETEVFKSYFFATFLTRAEAAVAIRHLDQSITSEGRRLGAAFAVDY